MTSLTPKSLLFLALLLFIGRAAAGEAPSVDRAGWLIHRELLPHSNDSSKKVELFWTKPDGDGPFPVLLYIHGHQETERNGGEAYVQVGRLGIMASRGYVAAAVSQPGYGNSTGPPDFCGPVTQSAALEAIGFLRRQAFVNPNKTGLYGYSRGAIVASMVATQDPRLAAVILGAGAYDLFKWYPTSIHGIDANIRGEAGTSAEAFRVRSASYHAEKIRAPVLLLHGAHDERIPVQQATAFAEILKANGIPLRFKIFPDAGHSIPLEDQYREVYPFLEDFLR